MPYAERLGAFVDSVIQAREIRAAVSQSTEDVTEGYLRRKLLERSEAIMLEAAPAISSFNAAEAELTDAMPLNVAVIGSGNIGSDLMFKIFRNAKNHYVALTWRQGSSSTFGLREDSRPGLALLSAGDA